MKWSQLYDLLGLLGLKLGYRGSGEYLTVDQKAAILSWIKAQNYWHLPELQAYLEYSMRSSSSSNRAITIWLAAKHGSEAS